MHVTVVKAVSKGLRPASSPLTPPLTGASRRRVQDGPCLEFSVVDHQFVSRGECALAVVEDDESTHAEVCSFACSAALCNLFTQRLRAGSARTGDDAGLTRLLLCPCAEDLQYMLKSDVPRLQRGLLEELMTGMQEEACGKFTLNERLPLLQRLRVALGLQAM